MRHWRPQRLPRGRYCLSHHLVRYRPRGGVTEYLGRHGSDLGQGYGVRDGRHGHHPLHNGCDQHRSTPAHAEVQAAGPRSNGGSELMKKKGKKVLAPNMLKKKPKMSHKKM